MDEASSTQESFELIAGNYARPAKCSDIPRATDIWIGGVAASFGPTQFAIPPANKIDDQLSKLIKEQTVNYRFWVLCDESDTALGWSTVQPFHTTPFEQIRLSYGFISTYMHSSCHGKGLGRALMQFTIDYCRNHTTIAYVIGIQDRNNLSSVRMTDRVGFVDFGCLPKVAGLTACSLIVCKTK